MAATEQAADLPPTPASGQIGPDTNAGAPSGSMSSPGQRSGAKVLPLFFARIDKCSNFVKSLPFHRTSSRTAMKPLLIQAIEKQLGFELKPLDASTMPPMDAVRTSTTTATLWMLTATC